MKINYVALYQKYHYFSQLSFIFFALWLLVCKNTLTIWSFPLHCDCGLNSSCLSMWLPLWPLVTCRHRCPSFSKCWLRHSWNTPTFTSLLYNHSFNGRWFWTVAMRCGLREAHSQAFLHPLQISDLSLNSFRCWLVEVISTYCTASVEAQKN